MKDDNRQKFAEKLASFANDLTHEEQTMFREVLERGAIPEADLRHIRPGQVSNISMAALAAKLDSRFFHRLLDW
jgi:hypothetical protein